MCIFSRHSHHHHFVEFWYSFGTRKLTSKFDVLCTVPMKLYIADMKYNIMIFLYIIFTHQFFMWVLILSYDFNSTIFRRELVCSCSSYIFGVFDATLSYGCWAWMTLKVVLLECRILQSNCQLCILFSQLSVLNERNKVVKMKKNVPCPLHKVVPVICN